LTPMPGPVTLDCPAKLNLALAVAPPDPTDPKRLHPIASWMVALSFGDRLTVSRLPVDAGKTADTPESRKTADASETACTADSIFDFAYGDDAPSPRVIDWPLVDDLVFRAHGLVERHVGRPLPVRVALEKRIPTGAGLGGGSSDAAGMIVALDRLFDLQLTADDHRTLAAALGSDVHFALGMWSGVTSAIVTGAGDRVERAPECSAWPIDLVLVLPEFGCPTGPVYAAFDRLDDVNGGGRMSGPIDPSGLHVLAHAFSPSPAGAAALFNDLSDAAAEVEPRLGELLNRLRETTPLPVHVTGSGAACFIVTQAPAAAAKLAKKITADLDVAAIATRTK